MPIIIPDALPAAKTLATEGVQLIKEKAAIRQDVRPLQIAILNLMPLKEKTETQLARVLGLTPLQVELTFLKTATYEAKNAPKSHMERFYKGLDEVADRQFDGLVVTGAPIETMPFEDVAYWPEMESMFAWSKTNVFSTFNVCWGAQAALYYFHGVNKHMLPNKRFGIYAHRNLMPSSPLMTGINDSFPVPVSRHTEVLQEDLPANDLRILAMSPEAGLCALDELSAHRFYMFNHLEYDDDTLQAEYQRDVREGADTAMPVNYFPWDDPSNPPVNTWRSHAHMLFGNWVNYVYQNSPFDFVKSPNA